MKVAIFFRILITICVVSCATGENFNSIKEGMSKSQVMRVLGTHDKVSKKDGGWTTYEYKNRLISGWSWDKTDYYVVFDPDGKVYEYGHGEVDTRTSERMSELSAHQFQKATPTTIDCNSFQNGNYINTNCKTGN